ncbi:hypothetical protein N7449_009431 [Penicillium cf. viridicatum]|uniref:Uncharacterized protein n=1 Tax=Penicillium cf. viridicatum TaxID=2972119 RepID=A0A9W9JA13_9EURO|nr:hypothetical protein N7449_009431 [Penicillium cf. viridicatum]
MRLAVERFRAKMESLNGHKCVATKRPEDDISSTLVTDEWREMFLDTVESVCNEAAECDELGHFLNTPMVPKILTSVTWASARSRLCHLDFEFPDRPSVQARPPPDIAKSRDELRDHLQDNILGEAFIYGTVDEDLEVKVGFRTGLGSRREHDE